MITNPKRILWPTDFSRLSLAAADVARHLSQTFKAELHIVHVAPLLVWDSAVAIETAGDMLVGETDVRGPAEARLNGFVREYFGNETQLKHRVLIGNPWLEICNYAADANIDLIVISTHGLTGLKHVLMGSVAERVVQHARCSVLVVKSVEPKSIAPQASE